MKTDFVHWYLLSESDLHAPEEAGVYQIRVPKGLLHYPRGRSAMVQYGCTGNLRSTLRVLAAERSKGNFLCRHQSSPEPAVLLDLVRSRFISRFGCGPTWSEAEMDSQS